MDIVLDEMIAQAQGIGWRIALVRAVHGTRADTWSIEELLAEYERLHETVLTVQHTDGRTETMTKLRLRLAGEQAV